ncbi:tyrosine-protein kinase transmembrane receptor Ror-like isoform X2 [Clytia hemisphaerica]|uniref:tyrosine-protein kinase transmembrane receptor Ror-like isoform X2 n=1 Tax=Clytia hemisphaerica TaxID=252671 RepID=UPI0034D3A6AD
MVTSYGLWVFHLLIIAQCMMVVTSSSTTYDNNHLDNENIEGTCQLYNGTNSECGEYLAGQYVWIRKSRPLKRSEKKLKRWFRRSRQSGEISRECWPHAKALTCRLFYPRCDARLTGPDVKSLCTKDCKYARQMCDGEYRRALHSKYYQEFIPLCDDSNMFGDSASNMNLCEKLPTYNPDKGPVIFAESQKHTRRSSGERATLKCSFGIRNFFWDKKNKAMIREGTWLRNNRRVSANRRFSIKTKAKAKARLFMFLEIKQSMVKDQGEYHCEITFANQTIQSSAKLTVKPGRVVQSVIHPTNKDEGTNKANKEEKDKEEDEEITNKIREIQTEKKVENGKCSQYKGNICSTYLGQTVIFERDHQPMKLLNQQLENVIKILKRTKKLSKRCEEFGQAVLCYHTYPTCKPQGLFYTESLCKKDCLAFTNEYCRDELKLLQGDRGDKVTMDMLIPDCNKLREDSNDCIPITKNDVSLGSASTPAQNQLHNMVDKDDNCYDQDSKKNYFGTMSMSHDGKFCDKWNQYPGYEIITHDYCRNFNDEKPWCFSGRKKVYCAIKPCNIVNIPKCFTGKGKEYRGKIAVSSSGRKCLQWNEVTPRYANVYHSYCRNFIGDMDAPWCYVDQRIREVCAVPRCNDFQTSEKHTNKLVTYVVPFIVGMTVLLFSFFLFAFYWKNKKLLQQKNQEVVDLRDTNQRMIDDIDIQKTNTLSTSASYEFKKDIQLSTSPPSTEFTFVSPSTPPLELRQQPKRYKKNVPEVKEACFSNLIKIGDGKMGQLWQGQYKQPRDHKTIDVIVRKLRTDTRTCVISEFRNQMNSLRALKHPNIEQIVCVSLMSEVPFMAFDGRHKTDLKAYIFDNEKVSPALLLNFLNQISTGLEYIHQHKILHKDLAARNCFVTDEGVVYISKSGLGMYRYPNDYLNLSGQGLSPVRWLSPETLNSGIYRMSTDVYMFGVLVWELFSSGERPYDEYTDNDAIHEIINENRLICPGTCPAQIWNIVEQCWVVPGCQRPSSAWIRRNLRVLTSELNTNPVA